VRRQAAIAARVKAAAEAAARGAERRQALLAAELVEAQEAKARHAQRAALLQSFYAELDD
jgi:hypothetical protein|tara:strand:+ start:257 stop:436 length:180 start_codon:yes stop_codon:yes gene_type:complete